VRTTLGLRLAKKGKLASVCHIMSLAFILFLSPLLLTTQVKAENGPIFSEGAPSTFPPTSVNGSESPLGYANPYVAGYMTNDHLSGNPGDAGRAKAVRVTVSLAGTDQSIIQSDNALGCGIAAQGSDSRDEGLMRVDWGYTLLLVVNGIDDDPFIMGEIYECFEWGRSGLWPLEPAEVDLDYSWSWNYSGVLTIDSSVTLKMEWSETHLNYYATIEGYEYSLTSYAKRETQNPVFCLGIVDREWGFIPLGGTVKWFQFPGAWSYYDIGTTGWISHLKYPAYRLSGESLWSYVDFAYSVHGMLSYLDHTLYWGKVPYIGVSAHYVYEPWDLPPREVIFYPTSDGTTIPANTLLWDPFTGGGGCPFMYVWNGTNFVIDNNLLSNSSANNGTEVEDYYRLEQDLVPLYEGYFNSYYSLQISEFQQEHSYLDEVDLFAVDHATDVSVAVSLTGDILTYQSPYAPSSAVDENDTSWLAELSEIDGDYYESCNGSFLVLNFGEVNSSDAKLILVADPPPLTKKSIIIQVLNSSESWVDVVSIIPRVYWATDITDLSEYLPSDGALVRLYFTDIHRVDFVGLDTTPQAEIDVEDANLLWAYHSEEGTVTAELRSDNDVYAELVPDQQITLLFRAPNPDAEARTFIFYVKGYYYTITG